MRHMLLTTVGLLVISLLSTCFSLEHHHGVAVTKSTAAHRKSNGTTTRMTPPFDHVDFSDLLDSTLLPDYWNTADPALLSRIQTNGEIPEQLVKVTDRRHRFPVFATACSLAFLVTIIAIIVICTQ